MRKQKRQTVKKLIQCAAIIAAGVLAIILFMLAIWYRGKNSEPVTDEQVAAQMGKSRPAIANTLRLLALPEDLLTLVEEGTLSAGHARAILGAPTEDLQREAAKQVVSRNLSVRQTEQLVILLQ